MLTAYQDPGQIWSNTLGCLHCQNHPLILWLCVYKDEMLHCRLLVKAERADVQLLYDIVKPCCAVCTANIYTDGQFASLPSALEAAGQIKRLGDLFAQPDMLDMNRLPVSRKMRQEFQK